MNKSAITVAMVMAVVSSAFAELPNPIAWFDMKEMVGAKVKDASGNGRNLTLGSTVQIVDDATVGKALKVNGKTSDWAQFTAPVVADTTVAFWVKRDAKDCCYESNAVPYMLATGYSGYGINYSYNKANICVIDQWDALTDQGQQLNLAAATASREVWHYVVTTISRTLAEDGQSAVFTNKLYVDGALASVKAQTALKVHARSGKTTTATLMNSGANAGRATSGLYADFRFYDVCLSDEQVKELYPASAPRLLLRYSFDEISATADAKGQHTTPESTGNGLAMTLGKNTTLVDDGVEGKAVRFISTNGIGGAFTIPSMALTERTWSVWIRQSSERTNMNAIVANPYPRLFEGDCYGQFSDCSGYGRFFYYWPYTKAVGTTVNYSIVDFDVWSHLTIVDRIADDCKMHTDVYVNGKLAAAGSANTIQALAKDQQIVLGNRASDDRYFCGDMDEFRVYNYALSSNEVRRLYRGLAAISAGEDFTVAGTKGTLHGRIAANADDDYRKGYAGETKWTLVSAPAGGEAATIEQPLAAETAIMLPVAGEYVFRFSIADLGVTNCDDVAVTCVAAVADNVAPTISITANAYAITIPDEVALTATVSDDGKPAPAKVRVRWAKKTGTGGVWFSPDDATTTRATFGAAGTYVLLCTADDGEKTSSAEVTIAVSDRTDGLSLSSDLLHYWSLDGQVNPYCLDPIGKKTGFTAPDYENLCYLPGKFGNGARAFGYCGTGAYWYTGGTSDEVGQTEDASGTAYSGNLPPVNDYLTISAWIYIDPEDANLKAGNVIGASIVGQSHTFGLRYNEKFTYASAINTDGFTLFQQGRNGTDASGSINWSMVHFPPPAVSAKGRWMHICGILARNKPDCTLWEMWYDGVKQTASSTTGSARGRVNGGNLLIGGMSYTDAMPNGGDYNSNWAKIKVSTNVIDRSLLYSRTFPGIVDEVRIWKRKLSAEEIRYLAANPIIDANKGPSAAEVTAPTKAETHEPMDVVGVSFADKLPEGGVLAYEWQVIDGDASKVTIASATSAQTTVTFNRAGTYTLQLKVTDGERTVYSTAKTVDVPKRGLVLFFK